MRQTGGVGVFPPTRSSLLAFKIARCRSLRERRGPLRFDRFRSPAPSTILPERNVRGAIHEMMMGNDTRLPTVVAGDRRVRETSSGVCDAYYIIHTCESAPQKLE